jgi:hypothetical protein
MISAIALFSLLGQANVWFDPTSNVLLAFGYRFLLILTPLTLFLFKKHSLLITLLASVSGLILLSMNIAQGTNWIAVLLFGYGISVMGFIVKNDAAKTPIGAANNKIMLNLGSLCAGLLLLYPHWDPLKFYLIMIFMLLSCLPAVHSFSLLAGMDAQKKFTSSLSKSGKFKWILAGIVTGIKLFAVFSILPQEILAHRPALPSWYGIMIILNSAIVTAIQLPLMKMITRSGSSAMLITIMIIFIGLVVLSMPEAFHVYSFCGAFIWITILSIAECGLSYIDYCAAEENSLLTKEISVSLGTGLTVLIMRYIPLPINTHMLSYISIITLFLWLVLYINKNKATQKENPDAVSDFYKK